MRTLLLSAGAGCTAPAAQTAGVLQSIDISCPPGAQQQTPRTPLLRLLLIYGTDRQTDDRFTGPASHSMRAASVKCNDTEDTKHSNA